MSKCAILPGDKAVPFTRTPGFDRHSFSGLFADSCDPSRLDPRYTSARFQRRCANENPGEPVIECESIETRLGS